jgi:hypothetical protein
MKHRNQVLIFILFFPVLFVCSQESKKLSLGFEFGSDFVKGDMNDKWNVRQEVGTNYYDYLFDNTENTLNTNMSIRYFGIKPEFLLAKDRFSIGSGLRFSRINSSLTKNSSTDNAYFILLYNQTGLTSEYAKIKKINQDNDYLGVPFEITYYPLKYELISIYARIGTELNFKLKSNTDIQFLNQNMETYQQIILNKVGVTSNSIYSTFYSSIGFQYGKVNEVKYNFDILLPSRILTKNNSSLINSTEFSGFQLSVQVPIK